MTHTTNADDIALSDQVELSDEVRKPSPATASAVGGEASEASEGYLTDKPDKETDTPLLGERFARALTFTHSIHRHQIRKGSETPYISHLLAVAGLCLEHGGDEDLAIAALLHDAVEDQGGLPVLEQIREQFGSRVADVVLGCSDSTSDKGSMKPPWRLRKHRYLHHFEGDAPPDVRLVSMCDKLHNCRTTVSDLHEHGVSTFDKFNATRADIVWFYRAFSDLANRVQPGPLAREIDRVVAELERLA